MLEAVNSVLQSAPFVRASSEQTSTADSFAANPERVQRAAPQAPFVSPYIHMDVNFDKAVIQLRNGDTGDVIDQFPSESSLEQRARQLARQQVSAETQAAAPKQPEERGAQEFVRQASPDTGDSDAAAITAQQQAAFAAAARSGNTNAGHVTLFA